MSINVYTGSLNYQNAEYQFVFHDDELHLIPPPEVAENILWGYERKEIAPGVYTSGDPLRMKESVEKVGHDLSDTIDIFGQQLYSLNGEVLNYSEMGKRLADQRNNYAHGNLDKEFIGNSLLDLVYLQ